jgi:hypothetical protein
MSIRINIASPPDDSEGLVEYLEDTFTDIESSFEETADGVHEVLYLPPVKPKIGQVVYAADEFLDPLSLEGLYVYKSTGWVFIG